jgi:hypothetical protein
MPPTRLSRDGSREEEPARMHGQEERITGAIEREDLAA